MNQPPETVKGFPRDAEKMSSFGSFLNARLKAAVCNWPLLTLCGLRVEGMESNGPQP